MLSFLENYRPTGKTAAERLRNTPAVLLVEWVPAIDELREQYREGTHLRSTATCPLCLVDRDVDDTCESCPWPVFENMETCVYRSPARRIRELGNWRKRIQAELKRRGV